MVYSAAAQSSNFNNNQYNSNQNYNNQYGNNNRNNNQNMNNNNWNMNNNNNWNNNNNNQMWRDSSRGMYGNNYNNNNQYGNNQYGMYNNRGGQPYYGFNKFNSFNIQWQNDYEGNHRYARCPELHDINADFFYQCPDNKVMTGMSSMANPNRNSNDPRMQGSDGENSNVFNNNNNYRETGWQDRQFKSACCMVHNKTPVNCRLSDWVNNWNEFFPWWTRHASVINGVYSEYSPAVRDRRWKFVYCDLM